MCEWSHFALANSFADSIWEFIWAAVHRATLDHCVRPCCQHGAVSGTIHRDTMATSASVWVRHRLYNTIHITLWVSQRWRTFFKSLKVVYRFRFRGALFTLSYVCIGRKYILRIRNRRDFFFFCFCWRKSNDKRDNWAFRIKFVHLNASECSIVIWSKYLILSVIFVVLVAEEKKGKQQTLAINQITTTTTATAVVAATKKISFFFGVLNRNFSILISANVMQNAKKCTLCAVSVWLCLCVFFCTTYMWCCYVVIDERCERKIFVQRENGKATMMELKWAKEKRMNDEPIYLNTIIAYQLQFWQKYVVTKYRQPREYSARNSGREKERHSRAYDKFVHIEDV